MHGEQGKDSCPNFLSRCHNSNLSQGISIPIPPSPFSLSIRVVSSLQRVNRCVLPQGWAPCPPSCPSFPGMDLETGGSPDLISKTNTLELSLLPVSSAHPSGFPSAAGLDGAGNEEIPTPEPLGGFLWNGGSGDSTGADGCGEGRKMNVKTPKVALSVKNLVVCLKNHQCMAIPLEKAGRTQRRRSGLVRVTVGTKVGISHQSRAQHCREIRERRDAPAGKRKENIPRLFGTVKQLQLPEGTGEIGIVPRGEWESRGCQQGAGATPKFTSKP